ncbi:MAG TPA: S9 family peptidase [Steroidobacter sp.]|nr:S9 family peptidase [Steroidobacteraceae bacterium]HLS81793.1 S9 family peptidase [Steroidobacter sp.]
MSELPIQPPKAAARLRHVASPHGVREDPWYWLRDDSRTDPQVLAHLAAETAYAEAMLAPCSALIAAVDAEIVARIKQDDASVPVRDHGYWYTVRYAPGCEYPVIVRRADRPDAPEEVLLDCNALAVGHAFFQLGGYEVSPDNRLLAYAEDTVGRRQFRLRIRDLATGRMLPDVLENVEPDVAWADDNRTFLYIEKDPVTLLGRRVRAHVLGEPPAQNRIVYEEPDESFALSVERSRSDRFIFIGSESTTSSEWRYASAADPTLTLQLFAPREADHEHQIDHLGDDFYVRTNWQAHNFRIMKVPIVHAGERGAWRDVIAHDAQVYVQSFELFRDFIAVSERSGGLLKIRVQRWGEEPFHVEADDAAYSMHIGDNPEVDSTKLRFVYTSLTTPSSVYDQDVVSGERVLLKREPVLGDFDPANYTSEFIWAPARDGELVPVSIVYRNDTPRDGSAPLYLYAYGSYGLSMDPAFSSARLSLLDRGFVYAIAHVRGGQELGRRWYDAGRLQQKWNTFNDFLDVTDYLVEHRYCAPGKVYAAGGSAGGLLMGVIANAAPEKYAGLIAHVPFVDIVTTMLDESIPLTTLEYDEWGDPREREHYEYMLSYSPYDNVREQSYPPILATTGLWDSQVQYYEPAKWIARLRAHNRGDSPLLLHVNMEAGHGGKSGRFQHMYEIAREYGFVIALERGMLGASRASAREPPGSYNSAKAP